MAEFRVWLTDQVDKRSSLGKKSRTRRPINRIPDLEAPQNEPDNGGSEQQEANDAAFEKNLKLIIVRQMIYWGLNMPSGSLMRKAGSKVPKPVPQGIYPVRTAL